MKEAERSNLLTGADWPCSTDNKSLILPCATITSFAVSVAATGKGNPFLLGEAKWFVSLSSFAFGLIGSKVWFWYPEQCKSQMFHLLFRLGLACCSYCCSLTFWILLSHLGSTASISSLATPPMPAVGLSVPYKGKLSFWDDVWRVWVEEDGIVL